MPIDEVQERLREAVHAHFYTLANFFKERDYANIGVISREDFKDVMDKNVMRFTDEQVQDIFSDNVNDPASSSFDGIYSFLNKKYNNLLHILDRNRKRLAQKCFSILKF